MIAGFLARIKGSGEPEKSKERAKDLQSVSRYLPTLLRDSRLTRVYS